jgi:hypothetical protein
MGRVAEWSRLAAFGRQFSGSTSSLIEMVRELGRRERFSHNAVQLGLQRCSLGYGPCWLEEARD